MRLKILSGFGWRIQLIAKVTRKAKHIIGNIRSFHYLRIITILLQFKGIKRPILEYARSVWKPNEKIQNEGTL